MKPPTAGAHGLRHTTAARRALWQRRVAACLVILSSAGTPLLVGWIHHERYEREALARLHDIATLLPELPRPFVERDLAKIEHALGVRPKRVDVVEAIDGNEHVTNVVYSTEPGMNRATSVPVGSFPALGAALGGKQGAVEKLSDGQISIAVPGTLGTRVTHYVHVLLPNSAIPDRWWLHGEVLAASIGAVVVLSSCAFGLRLEQRLAARSAESAAEAHRRTAAAHLDGFGAGELHCVENLVHRVRRMLVPLRDPHPTLVAMTNSLKHIDTLCTHLLDASQEGVCGFKRVRFSTLMQLAIDSTRVQQLATVDWDSLAVVCDVIAPRLQRGIAELLRNAAESGADRLFVSGQCDDHRLIIEIRNRMRGSAEVDLLNTGRQYSSKGSDRGRGCMIARQALEAHYGGVAYTQVDTVFCARLWFPRFQTSPHELRLLLVDDNASERDAVYEAFSEHRASITCTWRDGRRPLSQEDVCSLKPDIILVDLDLGSPMRNGYDVIDDIWGSAPCIHILSGRIGDGAQVKAAGGVRLVGFRKPLTSQCAERILETLKRITVTSGAVANATK